MSRPTSLSFLSKLRSLVRWPILQGPAKKLVPILKENNRRGPKKGKQSIQEPVGDSDKYIAAIADNLAKASAESVVVICGAGISTAAGIPDFRTKGRGIFSRDNSYGIAQPHDIFSRYFFPTRPRVFYQVSAEISPLKGFHPTYTHHFLAHLSALGKLAMCFTQNIDALEHTAGIDGQRVMACHGSYADGMHCIGTLTSECQYRQQDVSVFFAACADMSVCHCPSCGRPLKPCITFYYEDLPEEFYHRGPSIMHSERTKTLLVLGTSLQVAPVSMLPAYFSKSGTSILVNREAVGPTYDALFQHCLRKRLRRLYSVDNARISALLARIQEVSGLLSPELEKAVDPFDDYRQRNGLPRVQHWRNVTDTADATLDTVHGNPKLTGLLSLHDRAFNRAVREATKRAKALSRKGDMRHINDILMNQLQKESAKSLFYKGDCDHACETIAKLCGWHESILARQSRVNVACYPERQINAPKAPENLITQYSSVSEHKSRTTLAAFSGSLIVPTGYLFSGEIVDSVNDSSGPINVMIGLISSEFFTSINTVGHTEDALVSHMRIKLSDTDLETLRSLYPNYLSPSLFLPNGSLLCISRKKDVVLENAVVYAPPRAHWSHYCVSFIGIRLSREFYERHLSLVGESTPDLWDLITREAGSYVSPRFHAFIGDELLNKQYLHISVSYRWKLPTEASTVDFSGRVVVCCTNRLFTKTACSIPQACISPVVIAMAPLNTAPHA